MAESPHITFAREELTLRLQAAGLECYIDSRDPEAISLVGEPDALSVLPGRRDFDLRVGPATGVTMWARIEYRGFRERTPHVLIEPADGFDYDAVVAELVAAAAASAARWAAFVASQAPLRAAVDQYVAQLQATYPGPDGRPPDVAYFLFQEAPGEWGVKFNVTVLGCTVDQAERLLRLGLGTGSGSGGRGGQQGQHPVEPVDQ